MNTGQLLTQSTAMKGFSPVQTALLQRTCACGQHTQGEGECEDCRKKGEGLLQRKPLHESVRDPWREARGVPSVVHEALRSPGQALDRGTRSFMEPRFGQDFSHVRVHADAKAGDSARAVNALAYTVGRDVVFGAGLYRPDTSAGQRLLAHELTHVIQQRNALPAEKLELGAPDSPLEREAEHSAARLPQRFSGIHGAQSPLVQRQSVIQTPGAGLGLNQPLFPPLNLPSESLEIEASESISAKNPKLIQIAQSFKSLQSGNPDAHIKLSAEYSEGSGPDTVKGATEGPQLRSRLMAVRDALRSMGVPGDQISIQSPTVTSTSAHGQVSVDLYKARSASPLTAPPQPFPWKTPPKPSPSTGSPSLSDLLTLKFGPVTVNLPKSIELKLPFSITAGKTLEIDLTAKTSGDFSFSITLDNLTYVKVTAKAGVSYDKEKGFTGSAGVEIQLVDKVCHASGSAELKDKINKAGEKLQKAMKEYGTETDQSKKLMKLPDIAGAIGDMYDAVEKSKAGCKPTPRATIEFGYKGPLGGGTETDPTKRQAPYIGGTFTYHF